MSKAAPPVSIGLPVRNGGDFLAATLDSLGAQSFVDFDVLVIDNASTDDTVEIVEEYARDDSRVRLVRHDSNQGAAANFNRSFFETTGRYFKWAAHDDRYEQQWLERVVEVLDDDPGVSLAYTVTVDLDLHGTVVGGRRAGRYATQSDPVGRAADIILRPSPCYETFGLARRRELERTRLIGPYASSDRPLLLELACIGRYHEVEEPLFLHCQHPQRSVHAHLGGRDRGHWFAPDVRGADFPVWRLGVEYRRAAARHLGHVDRARVDSLLLRWAGRNKRRLSREVARAAAVRLSWGRAPQALRPGSATLRTAGRGVER